VTPYYADPWLTVYEGDCRAVLAALPAESVHTVVTSPPYWGLRDYGTATWWGGDPTCDHIAGRGGHLRDSAASTRGGANKVETAQAIPYRDVCGKCGATRVDSQLGLEPTPEEYVANMVAVFREVRRVLRADGTLWLNLGDSYAGGGTSPQGLNGQMAGRAVAASRAERRRNGLTGGTRTVDVSLGGVSAPGLKPKDLVGIPWRVAFALQADGWYLRSDIIWAKPNPMPESVTDRPTKAHEYLFLLSKSPRYYYDADAVREGFADERMGNPGGGSRNYAPGDRNDGTDSRMLVWDKGAERGGRNLRSVWTVATQPYPGAHFATFPPKLIEPAIKAGCPELGTVLDPFAGSGTTGMVAQSLSRRAVLIDLNGEYLTQVMARNRDIPLGLDVA
jgi:DNA modification methylase